MLNPLVEDLKIDFIALAMPMVLLLHHTIETLDWPLFSRLTVRLTKTELHFVVSRHFCVVVFIMCFSPYMQRFILFAMN